MPEILIADSETDNLLPKLTKLHMIQLGTADGDDVTIYCDTAPPEEVEKAREQGMTAPIRPLAEGVDRIRSAERTIWHNLFGFDFWAVNKFYPGLLTPERDLDTLVLARMVKPIERDHRLKTWGVRLGVYKGDYSGDFQQVDAELLVYAPQDIVVGRGLWHAVKDGMTWGACADMEHRFAYIMRLQETHGFKLNLDKAQELDAELRGLLSDIDRELQLTFPPIERVTPFVPKVNNATRGYVKGVTFYKRHLEPFNPASRANVAERLMALGWTPKAFGDDGIATVDETTLAPLPYPEAKILLRRTSLAKRLSQLADGKTGWLKLVDASGYVHGRVNGTGCAPGRASHSGPNMANVDKQDHRMRAVWEASPGRKLIGVDGDGIQARILAHYLSRFDGGAFTERLINGSKSTRTDIHSANLSEMIKVGAVGMALDAPQELWDKGRDAVAKRCLYASWFGAQDAKIGWTAKDGARAIGLPVPRMPNRELGALIRLALNRAIKGFAKLCEALQKAVESRGYLIGPSGRHVPIKSRHSVLVFLMQCGEADVMKTAAGIFHFEEAPKLGLIHGRDFDYCAHVHDEAQFEANDNIAEIAGEAYARCIGMAGERLRLRCPHKGSMKIGANWADTH